jgi:para-aminobenzoate synthetase component 1
MFWKSGLLAKNVSQVVTNVSKFNPGNGFWAIAITFEGDFLAIEFKDVIETDFPKSDWLPVESSWQSSFTRDEYKECVEQIKGEISIGEVYQVNLCRVLETRCEQSIAGLFAKILRENPAPQAAYLRLNNPSKKIEIASASPELFISKDGNRIKCSPIKGTNRIPQFGEKDRAENIMILDLMRNDFGRICAAGSIEVTRLLDIESHPGLYHLVSDVEGNLRSGITWPEIFAEVLPAGSISGAPKSSALNLISKLEKFRRGYYCGIFGYIHKEKAELSVGIRLFAKEGERLSFGTGAGITWASDPESEWQETELKANKLIAIATGQI